MLKITPTILSCLLCFWIMCYLLVQYVFILQLIVWACTKTHLRRNKTQFAQQRLTKSTEPFNRFPIQPKWSVPLPCTSRGPLRGASSVCSRVCLISKPRVKWRGKSLLLPPHPQTSQHRAYSTRGSWPRPTATVSGAEREMERWERDNKKWSEEQISKLAERLKGLGDKVRAGEHGGER